jgi:ADP-heptose:LPS heptosyltransferase
VNRPRLVVLRALGLGDLFAAVPALRALARAFPDHRRVLVAPMWQLGIVRLTETVETVAACADLVRLPPAVRGADVAVNFHGRGPRSTRLLTASAPARLIAFDIATGPAWQDDVHERTRWCQLLEHYGIAADPRDLAVAAPQTRLSRRWQGATIVHPGAASPARRWPVARWGEVAAAEEAAGRQVVITGSASEVALAYAVARAARLPSERVLAGRTGAVELVALIAAGNRLLSADTGVAHAASATGTPSVVLFGPTSPAQWGPPEGGPHIVLWKGGRGDPHGGTLDRRLAAITVGEVLDACARLPQRLQPAALPAGG